MFYYGKDYINYFKNKKMLFVTKKNIIIPVLNKMEICFPLKDIKRHDKMMHYTSSYFFSELNFLVT